MFNIVSSSKPYLVSGKLRALAVSGAVRSSALPEVPTIAEAGVPGYEAVSWHGLLAPAKTPPSVLSRLYSEVHAILGEPDIRQTLEQQGFDIREEGPAAFQAFVATEVIKWTKVVKESGARVD